MHGVDRIYVFGGSTGTGVTDSVEVYCPGLVAHWKFNTGRGTVATDSSGNGHEGTLQNGPVWTTDVAPVGGGGNALSFDGSDDTVTVPDSPELRLTTALTLQAWIKREGAWTHSGRIICKRHDVVGTGFGCGVDLASSRFGVHLAGNDSFYSSGTVPMDQWTHVAASFDSSEGSVKLYINGILDSEHSTGTPCAANSLDLQIGRQGNGPCHFRGKIDEAKVYDYARPHAAIADDAGHNTRWDFEETFEDGDADGFCDLHEYIAGTCPTNNAEYLKINRCAVLADSGTVIYWDTVLGRAYTVYCSENLSSAWSNLYQAPGDGMQRSCTDGEPVADRRFYRLGVELQE
ncbi:LamG domain-containing protein [Verrucomicrobiota bacterium]